MECQIDHHTKFYCGRCGNEVEATFSFKSNRIAIATCWDCIRECTPPKSGERTTPQQTHGDACQACGGTGRYGRHCTTCNGTGKLNSGADGKT